MMVISRQTSHTFMQPATAQSMHTLHSTNSLMNTITPCWHHMCVFINIKQCSHAVLPYRIAVLHDLVDLTANKMLIKAVDNTKSLKDRSQSIKCWREVAAANENFCGKFYPFLIPKTSVIMRKTCFFLIEENMFFSWLRSVAHHIDEKAKECPDIPFIVFIPQGMFTCWLMLLLGIPGCFNSLALGNVMEFLNR